MQSATAKPVGGLLSPALSSRGGEGERLHCRGSTQSPRQCSPVRRLLQEASNSGDLSGRSGSSRMAMKSPQAKPGEDSGAGISSAPRSTQYAPRDTHHVERESITYF